MCRACAEARGRLHCQDERVAKCEVCGELFAQRTDYDVLVQAIEKLDIEHVRFSLGDRLFVRVKFGVVRKTANGDMFQVEAWFKTEVDFAFTLDGKLVAQGAYE